MKKKNQQKQFSTNVYSYTSTFRTFVYVRVRENGKLDVSRDLQ